MIRSAALSAAIMLFAYSAYAFPGSDRIVFYPSASEPVRSVPYDHKDFFYEQERILADAAFKAARGKIETAYAAVSAEFPRAEFEKYGPLRYLFKNEAPSKLFETRLNELFGAGKRDFVYESGAAPSPEDFHFFSYPGSGRAAIYLRIETGKTPVEASPGIYAELPTEQGRVFFLETE